MSAENEARLRELCQRASKEQNPTRLIELIRQINELVEQKPKESQKGKSAQGELHSDRAIASSDVCAKGLTDDTGTDIENPA